MTWQDPRGGWHHAVFYLLALVAAVAIAAVLIGVS